MTDSIRNDVSSVIARRLESLGKSQAELAEAVGVSPGTISHWISGRRFPRDQHYDAICRFLGITREELVGGNRDYMVDDVLLEVQRLGGTLNAEGKARLLRYAQDMAKLYRKE